MRNTIAGLIVMLAMVACAGLSMNASVTDHGKKLSSPKTK